MDVSDKCFYYSSLRLEYKAYINVFIVYNKLITQEKHKAWCLSFWSDMNRNFSIDLFYSLTLLLLQDKAKHNILVLIPKRNKNNLEGVYWQNPPSRLIFNAAVSFHHQLATNFAHLTVKVMNCRSSLVKKCSRHLRHDMWMWLWGDSWLLWRIFTEGSEY